MIALCSAECTPDPAVLRSPGGFTWFYVDLVDDRGRGATLIWSWGLPFLPGYAHAARQGRPELPLDRPSVNLVVYEEGRESFYLLAEFPPDRCGWSEDGRSWTLGDSVFTWFDTPAARPDAAPTRTLRAALNLELPTGGRATGTLMLSGPLRRDPCHVGVRRPHSATDHASSTHESSTHQSSTRQSSTHESSTHQSSTHQWAPMIAASQGCLDLRTPRGRLQVRGRGYHDRNSAEAPLQRLGIRSWWWGRLALPGRDLIFYRLMPSAPGAATRDLVVEVGADGTSRLCENSGVRLAPDRRSIWGLRWPRGAGFSDPDGRPVEVNVDSVVDNGPFYQRYLLSGRCGEEEGHGIGEFLVPGRVDGDLLRPLVRMRVHRAAGPNSMWLPLFSADRAGRVRRLFSRSSGGAR